MPDISSPVPFEVAQSVQRLGDRIRLARQRRRMSQAELARKSGVNVKTLGRLEKGEDGVSLGNALSVLWALGLLAGAAGLADPDLDEHGKTLEQARLPRRQRAPAPSDDF